MLKEVSSFIKTHFQRSENGLMQLVLINGLVFVALLLIKTILVLAGYKDHYQALSHYLSLPSSWEAFLYQPWSIITYFWVHERFLSLLWSLLFLHAFGQLIRHTLGNTSLVALYILGGIAGGSTFLLVYNLAPGLQGESTSLVGPAGSLYAVMMGAATLAPHFVFRLLFLGGIQLRYIAGFLLLLSFFELSSHQAVGVTQLGGALLGYVYVRYTGKGRRGSFWLIRFRKLFKKRGTLKVSHRQAKPTNQGTIRPVDQETIDAILDKIAESGYESLSQEEKQQLFHAGK